MTIHELIKNHNGIGFRASCIPRHRGSDGKGFVDATLYLKEDTSYTIVPFGTTFTTRGWDVGSWYGDVDVAANDWIPQECADTKLMCLIVRLL